jgi:hypothetical protein
MSDPPRRSPTLQLALDRAQSRIRELEATRLRRYGKKLGR